MLAEISFCPQLNTHKSANETGCFFFGGAGKRTKNSKLRTMNFPKSAKTTAVKNWKLLPFYYYYFVTWY